MYIDGEWTAQPCGDTFQATSPATGELDRTRRPQGGREDAQRAIDRGARGGRELGRLTAFERAAKMHAVGDLIESRRDDLAHALTLDQGKALYAESHQEVDDLVGYFRGAAEDALRLAGDLPATMLPGARVLVARRPGCRRRDHTRGIGRTRCRRRSSPRRSRSATLSCGFLRPARLLQRHVDGVHR